MQNKLIGLLGGLALPAQAWASSASGGLPWEAPLKTCPAW